MRPMVVKVGSEIEQLVFEICRIRQATWHATLLHPFIYVIDSKRALSFGEAQTIRQPHVGFGELRVCKCAG
jgi:hypothetical protein